MTDEQLAYEQYKLQWMIEHGYTLHDFAEGLTDNLTQLSWEDCECENADPYDLYQVTIKEEHKEKYRQIKFFNEETGEYEQWDSYEEWLEKSKRKEER